MSDYLTLKLTEQHFADLRAEAEQARLAARLPRTGVSPLGRLWRWMRTVRRPGHASGSRPQQLSVH